MEYSSGIPFILNKEVSDPQAPFEARFFLNKPEDSHAPEAAVRVLRPRPGILLRTDPFRTPVNRLGQPFTKCIVLRCLNDAFYHSRSCNRSARFAR